MNCEVCIFNSIHKATGGHAEEKKSNFFLQVEYQIWQENKEPVINPLQKTKKTLGAAMGLTLIWDYQFISAVNKMKDAKRGLKRQQLLCQQRLFITTCAQQRKCAAEEEFLSSVKDKRKH